MRIAVIGTGRVGTALGCRWAEQGKDVVFGTRDPASDKAAQLAERIGDRARVTDQATAAKGAEVVVLACPWANVHEVLERIDGAAGQILIDCINPLNASFSGLDLGFSESAAERIAGWAPQARVVKAFNSVSSATMADSSYNGQPATLFVSSDDAEAKQTVLELGTDLGFEAVDAGPLQNARYLEPLAMLYIHLAMNGWGSNCAFKILKRDKTA